MAYDQYTSEVTGTMELFEEKYGYQTWWLKGGYYSELWSDLFEYLGTKDMFPEILGQIDYTIEGISITDDGLVLLSGGFVVPDGSREPILGLSGPFVYSMNAWHAEIIDRLDYILSMANDLANTNPSIAGVVRRMYNDIVDLQNGVNTEIGVALDVANLTLVPSIMALYGDKGDIPGIPDGSLDYPAYIVIPSGLLTRYAALLLTVRQTEEDVRQTVMEGSPQGTVADYIRSGITGEEEKKSKAWMWMLGGGLVLTSVAIVGITVTRKKKKRG